MERHTANPLDEVDRLQSVIRRLEEANNGLRDEVTALKAKILAASDILGSGAGMFGQKPASVSNATHTSSARQQSAPKLPVGLNKRAPSTSSVRTTPLAQGLRKPQVSQDSKLADNPWLPAAAERFPLLATGRKPDLPSTRPDELTMPDISSVKSKGTPFDLAEYRRSCQKQVAEGTLPPITAEMEASFAPIRRVMESSQNPYPESEWKGEGVTFDLVIEDEDVEDRDVTGVDTTENLYDVSDTEASEPREVLMPFVKHTELTKRPDTKDQSKDEGLREPEAVPMLLKTLAKLKVSHMPQRANCNVVTSSSKTLAKRKVSHMPQRANCNVVTSSSVPLTDHDDRKLLAAFQNASETIKDTMNGMLRLDLGEDLRPASFADGKRKHGSDTDDESTRKRARATATSSDGGEGMIGIGEGEEEQEPERVEGLLQAENTEDETEDKKENERLVDTVEDDPGPSLQEEDPCFNPFVFTSEDEEQEDERHAVRGDYL